MNSYFASVEQQANPFLRNKPVGVCAYLSERGCIIAASKEAKKFGIKTGTLVYEAKKLYPKIFLMENNPDKYRSTTEKIFSIFADYSDMVEPYSIDEAFIDLTGFGYDFQKGKQLAKEIKKRIRNEVGEWLTCSVGVSETRFLAKLASELKKPDGLTLLPKTGIDKVLAKMQLTDVWGINFRLERHLKLLGIYNPLQLKNYPVTNLMQVFGLPGYYLWANLNGIEIEKVKNQEQVRPKSIGHSYCIPKWTTDLSYLRKVIMKLCEKTGRRLRANNLEAHAIMAGLGYVEGGGIHKIKRTPEPLFHTPKIFYYADKILFSKPLYAKVRFLAVSVTGLKNFSNQLNLFENDKLIKLRKQAVFLDKINDKYGDYTIFPGRMWESEDMAKDRIGFRKSVEIKKPTN